MLARACFRTSASLYHRAQYSNIVEPPTAISAVKKALEWAVSSAEYTTESASQAYLEADPAKRGPKVTYLLRYQKQAQQEIEKALKMYDELDPDAQKDSRGDAEFALLHADTMLARDNLDALIEGHEKKLSASDAAQQLAAQHTNI